MKNIEEILSLIRLNQVGNTLVGKLILGFGAVSIVTAALVSHGVWRAKVDKMVWQAYEIEKSGELDKAITAYESVLNEDSRNSYAKAARERVVFMLAHRLEQSGQYNAALDAYNKVLQEYPKNTYAQQGVARVKEELRQAGIRREVDGIYNTLEAQGSYCDAERAYWRIYYRENYNNDYAKAARDRVNRKMNAEKPLGGLFYSLGCFLGVDVDASNR